MKMIVRKSLIFIGISACGHGLLAAGKYEFLYSIKGIKSTELGQPINRQMPRPILYWGEVASGGEANLKETVFFVKYPKGSGLSRHYKLVSLQLFIRGRIYSLSGAHLTEECLKAIDKMSVGEKLIISARCKNKKHEMFLVKGEWVLK